MMQEISNLWTFQRLSKRIFFFFIFEYFGECSRNILVLKRQHKERYIYYAISFFSYFLDFGVIAMKMSDKGVKLLQVFYTLTKYISNVQIILELALGTRGLNKYLNTHSSRRVKCCSERLLQKIYSTLSDAITIY